MEPISQRGRTGFYADNGPKKMPFSQQYSNTHFMCVQVCAPKTPQKLYIKEQSMEHHFQSLPRWGHSNKRVGSERTRNRVISVRVPLV